MLQASEHKIGDRVQIRPGYSGDGNGTGNPYKFTVTGVGVCDLGLPVVYGASTGPRWAHEVEPEIVVSDDAGDTDEHVPPSGWDERTYAQECTYRKACAELTADDPADSTIAD